MNWSRTVDNPFYIDNNGRVYDTEYDYAIMMAQQVKRKHGDTMTNIDFIISALGHGKNLELARRKRKSIEQKQQKSNISK